MKLSELFEDGRIVPKVNTTCDVQPGEIGRQANKFGLDVDSEGRPTKTYWFVPENKK